MSSAKFNKVQTVSGCISPEKVQIALPHEHILINAEPLYVKPPTDRQEGASKPFELPNLGWIRYFPYSHIDNLHVNSKDLAIKELNLLKKQAGNGVTVVDVTTEGIRSNHGRSQDIRDFKDIADATGVNIVCGCGYYIDKSHPQEAKSLSVDELAQKMIDAIQVGIDDSGVCAGVIGEIGCSWPITENEKKILEAASKAQLATGAPLIIHPGRNVRAPMEILNILAKFGARLESTVMSHLDRTVPLNDVETFKEIAKTGVYLSFDLFGTECSYYQQNEAVDMVSDAQRINAVKMLVDLGLENQIVLSHDIHTKHRLVEYGGHGYSHIPANIVPRLLLRGVSKEAVEAMIIKNPRRWLTFWK